MKGKITEIVQRETNLLRTLLRAYGGRIPEANTDLNNLQREKIAAIYEHAKKAYFGKINYHNKELGSLTADTVFEEYIGQPICNFQADFVVPAADSELAGMIVQWNMRGPLSRRLINKIACRVDEIGGVSLLWS